LAARKTKPRSSPVAAAVGLPSAKAASAAQHSQPEQQVLVLQGGGALGAYQAGAYAALHAHDYRPDWIAGISIGAINAAIIAGNPPERRVERLHDFWHGVSANLEGMPLIDGDTTRRLFNEGSAWITTALGIPGFFQPRVPAPLLWPAGQPQALSVYDTAPLKATLERLVDFDYLADKGPRLSVGAVALSTGNFVYFDSARERIEPEHIMASGALPPGFPPVTIGAECYWDGGLVSNTPLQYVLEWSGGPRRDMCIFQVDLFSAEGALPKTLFEVALREKAIRYSSRTRLNTHVFRKLQTLRRTVRRVLERLPAEMQDDPDVRELEAWSCDAAVTIVHLINRPEAYTLHSMDYEFSRISVQEHWAEGARDVERTVTHPDFKQRRRPPEGVAVFDLTRD
jgi:NTE family protein